MSNQDRRQYQKRAGTKAIAIPRSTTPWGRISDAYKRYQWSSINPTLTGFLQEYLDAWIN